jgi:Tol biopolymer transport system component
MRRRFAMRHQLMICGAAAILVLLTLHFGAAQSPNASDMMVLSVPSNQWFEGPGVRASISSDAKWALLTHGPTMSLFSLETHEQNPDLLLGGLTSVSRAIFCGSNALARLGERGSERGWFLPGAESPQLSTLPPDSVVGCSADGSEIVYYIPQNPDRQMFVGPVRGPFKAFGVTGRITGTAFSPDGSMLYVLLFQPSGETSLVRIAVHELRTKTIAHDLDASPSWNTIAISADGRSAFIALASAGAPDNTGRHRPEANRWLAIYKIDLTTGARVAVVSTPGVDNHDAALAGGNLYWARNVIRDSVAAVAVSGGDSKDVIVGAEVPMWSPDGKKISFTYGGWRLADWGLDLDAGYAIVDADANRISARFTIVSGYHEDFPAAWSPDGKWIAFHSHRSKIPVPDYQSAESTDDIYLRLADDPHAPEIRLTDFGWETGPAYWSPDGRKLLFSSWERGGVPGIDKLWVLGIQPVNGQVLDTTQLPLSAEIRSASWAAWSPDGKEIAIEDNRGGEDRALWIARADGTHDERLLDYQGTTYGGLDWTPDGKTIIYSGLAGDKLQLFSIPRAGGASVQLTHDAGNLMHPRVSPDGKWIACTRIVQSKQIWRRPLS